MEESNFYFESINPVDHLHRVAELVRLLNPELKQEEVIELTKQMSVLPGYICFGLFINDQLMGVASGWTTIRFYSGKQLELDNVVIDPGQQSKGLGQLFLDQLKQWAIDKEYKTIELNTYVNNSRSHKFYYNQGFKILGFHFQHTLG